MDTTKLGTQVAGFMERLEADLPEDAQLGEILVIAEMQIPGISDDDHGETRIHFSCTDPRAHVQVGLLKLALVAAERDE